MKQVLMSLSLALLVFSCGADGAPYLSDAETSE
jgi:hypothetical protein